MEKIYVGTKIVGAEPMSEKEFAFSKRQTWDESRPDRPGFKVRYDDGYISWSPRDVFLLHYREVTILEAQMVSMGQYVIPDSGGSTISVS